jgi:CRP/FNR family transcriptional regulator, anaerobic regulatory protein
MSLETFFNDCSVSKISANHVLMHQGDECRGFFLLVEGSIKIFSRASNGREVVLYHVLPGNICVLNTTCLLGNKRFPAEAVAETELVIKLLPKSRFDEMIVSRPAFREAVFASFGRRMGDLIATIESLALETIEQRLVNFLLVQPGPIISMTHQDISAEIGSVREVVSRNLKRFESRGWLRLERGRIELLERKALHQLM